MSKQLIMVILAIVTVALCACLTVFDSHQKTTQADPSIEESLTVYGESVSGQSQYIEAYGLEAVKALINDGS